MSTQIITLPWGKQKISLSLPPDWQLMGVLEPASVGEVYDLDQEVVRDGNLITSRTPDDLPAFCREIIAAMK